LKLAYEITVWVAAWTYEAANSSAIVKLIRRRMINLHDPYTTSVPRFKRSTVQRQKMQVPIVPIVPDVPIVKNPDWLGGFLRLNIWNNWNVWND
jgi:hypothetical protein